MMGNDCPVCGAENREAALVCTLCSHLLDRAKPELEPLSPACDPETLARLETESRRFGLLMPAGLMLWVILCVMRLRGDYPAAAAPLFTHPRFWLLLGAAAVALAAYGVAATARACGAPFWPCFLAALCPVAIPGVLARAARRPVAANAVYLLAETIVLFLLATVLAGAPGESPLVPLALAGVTAMLPLLAFNLCGGALAELARGLGLDPWRAIAWVCLGPPLVYAAFLVERHIQRGLNPFEPGAGGSAAACLAGRLFGGFSHCVAAPVLLWGFVILSVVIWLRAVHDSLRQPL